MTPYVVHRGRPGGCRRVTDRETGRLLGEVGQHPRGDEVHGGRWSAWGPFDLRGPAVGDLAETMEAAVAELLDPWNLQPPAFQRRCGRCSFRLASPPRPCETGECETEAEAVARARAEDPAAWEHFDWLVARRRREAWRRVAGSEALASELGEAGWRAVEGGHPWYVGRARVEARLDLRGLVPADLDGVPFADLLRPRDDGRALHVAGAVLRWPSTASRLILRRRAVVGFGWSEVVEGIRRPVAVRRWFEAVLEDDPA